MDQAENKRKKEYSLWGQSGKLGFANKGSGSIASPEASELGRASFKKTGCKPWEGLRLNSGETGHGLSEQPLAVNRGSKATPGPCEYGHLYMQCSDSAEVPSDPAGPVPES